MMSTPLLILTPLLAIVITGAFFWWLARHHGRLSAHKPDSSSLQGWPPESAVFFENPRAWFAIKTEDLRAVSDALNLLRTGPCPLTEAAHHAGERVFISPPVAGWTLVFGAPLPEPDDDIDRFFRFIMDLSRDLGLVVYFSSEPVFYHHAWVKASDGKVIRAYAWAEGVLWNQGDLTQAERELRLFCESYGTNASASGYSREKARLNADKVSALAARWALEPRSLDARITGDRPGIVGEFRNPKPH